MSVGSFTRSAGIATLVIGVISGFIPALQSTLLPQLVSEGRLTLAELGRVAMAEAIGTLVAVSLATALLRPERLRLLVVASAVIGLALDLVTPQLSGSQIIAARFGHGLCAGVLLWVWVGFLTRIDNPARWIAIYVTVQAAVLLVLSYVFAVILLPWGGAMGGFATVAILYGLMGVLALLIADSYPPLGDASESVMPGLAGFVGLTAVFCQLAAILALWVYVKPFGLQIGVGEQEAGVAMSIALGSQILAGLCAAAFAGKIRPVHALVGTSVASIAAIAVLGSASSTMAYTVGAVGFAFLWMFVPPFHMPYLIEIDPSRRAALHMSTAQLAGVAAGPALASLMVSQHDVRGALLLAALLYGLGGLIVAVTAAHGRMKGAA